MNDDLVGLRQFLCVEHHGQLLLAWAGAGLGGDQFPQVGTTRNEGQTMHEKAFLDDVLIFLIGKLSGHHDGHSGSFQATIF
jgi:hypothetical protein